MWEQLTRTDIERAKQKLAELRRITLRRQEEELKEIDAEEAEIETLERLAAAVAAKYLNPASTPSQATAEERPAPAALVEQSPEMQSGSVAPEIEVQQGMSPNFGIPLRRFVQR